MWLRLPILGAATSELRGIPDIPAADCSADHRREAMLSGSSPLTFRDSSDGSRPMTEAERLDALERARARLQKCPTAQQMTACEQAYASAVDGVDGIAPGQGTESARDRSAGTEGLFQSARESPMSR